MTGVDLAETSRPQTHVAINRDLDAKPELVNEDCYGKAWMIEIEVPKGGESALEQLLDEKAYAEHVKASAH